MGSRTLHLIGVATGICALAVAAAVSRPTNGRASPVVRSESEIRDLDIEFYRGRVERDRYGATDRAHLALHYLNRARERGDHADLLRSEEMARHSLSLRKDRNGAAFVVLASSLLAQHRFMEARAVAERVVALDSASPGARGMLAEIQLELGSYDEAARNFGMLVMRRADPTVAPRYARWEELRGRPEEARRLLRHARDVARGTHAMPAGQLAWFQLRLGDLALRFGRLREAESELLAGLAAAPTDYRLLGALARLELIRGRADRAIEYGERAVARVLDPGTLGILHDAHAARGDAAAAEQYARAMALAVLNQPAPLHRAWSMFLLDHGRAVDTVLARAREEIATRRDVYGWDLLGWALHRAGHHVEARDAMRQALAQGTRDATLEYHAGMIGLALGDSAEARRHLGRALAINPYWHHSQPAVSRAILRSR